ncbi:MAG: hypothetical protein JO303_15325, partial [Caulobacteraceae bacterium]|nr:hypothetical protein [Caulobacteraceae bacterium]
MTLDLLERSGPAPHIEDARKCNQQALQAKYSHEVAEHRRILFSRGSGMFPAWRNFRQFLVDLGPAPSDEHLATRVSPTDLSYSPGKVAWLHRDKQPALVDRWSLMESSPPSASGQWVTVRGKSVQYTALANHLGVPFGAMALALRNSQSPEELVQQASIGETLAQCDTPWLPAERREAFFKGFRMWHMQVQPRFAAAATPAFLYLYSALPSMVKCRDELAQADLWERATERGKSQRSVHGAWKRFCEV